MPFGPRSCEHELAFNRVDLATMVAVQPGSQLLLLPFFTFSVSLSLCRLIYAPEIKRVKSFYYCQLSPLPSIALPLSCSSKLITLRIFIIPLEYFYYMALVTRMGASTFFVGPFCIVSIITFTYSEFPKICCKQNFYAPPEIGRAHV